MEAAAFGIYHPPTSNVQSSKSKVFTGFMSDSSTPTVRPGECVDIKNKIGLCDSSAARTLDVGPWTLDFKASPPAKLEG